MEKRISYGDGAYAIIKKMVRKLSPEKEDLEKAEAMYVEEAENMIQEKKTFHPKQVKIISSIYKKVILPKFMKALS